MRSKREKNTGAGAVLLALWLAASVFAGASPLQAAEGSKPVVRPAAVAGLFYPANPEELRKALSGYLEAARTVQMTGTVRALVVPHAGYVYSAIVAAAGYKSISTTAKTVILLGPSHRFPLPPDIASIPDVAAFETPLGAAPLAESAQILRKHPLFATVAQAHEQEHSLEVQLPFLQVLLRDLAIVPILTNGGDAAALAQTLAPHVGGDTLVIASSDLSHYHPYDTAVGLDRICTEAISGGRFGEMAGCEACGRQAIEVLMHLARIKGWQGTLIDYRNSGDTAGDKMQVVGYASLAFLERNDMAKNMTGTLSPQDRKTLLRLARTSIEAELIKGAAVEKPQTWPSSLARQQGCFVTLHKRGHLRGCIGTIEPINPLAEGVEKNAKNAAFDDPRFPPLTAEELPQVDIEISVLTVPRRLKFEDGKDLQRQLEPRVHGVILSRGPYRSTFLPQVWEQLPDKEQFLEHLCAKGGLAPRAWCDPETTVKVYEAEVFGEE